MIANTNGNKSKKGVEMRMSLPWAEFISTWSNWTLIAALLIGVAATYGIVVSGDVEYLKKDLRESKERSEVLAVALEQAKNAAKQIDANVLHEQRLTANERWRLERIERAVLPRASFIDWVKLTNEIKALKIEKILIAKYIGPDVDIDVLSMNFAGLPRSRDACFFRYAICR